MEENIDPKIIAKYIMAYQQNADSLIKFQLENKHELHDFYLDLLGKEEDEEGNIIDSPFKFRMINEKGANVLISFLKPRITKIVSLSNLDEVEVSNRSLSYMNDLTYLLNRHMVEFEIPSFQILNSIIELCDDIYFTTLSKSKDAGERDTLRKTYQHVESSEHITQTQPKQSGILANPFAKRGNR